MGEFSFPRLVVFCLLPLPSNIHYVHSSVSVFSICNLWEIDDLWEFANYNPTFGCVCCLLSIFSFQLQYDEGEEEDARCIRRLKTQRCYTFIPFLLFILMEEMLIGKECS